MGIPGLTTFMNQKFIGWRPIDLKALDGVIIDGLDVCCTLYRFNHSWGLGGEHTKFYQTVEKFFTDASFKNPIVVFDGISDTEKTPLRRARRNDCVKELRDVQYEDDWDPNALASGCILPHLIVPVFIEVLEALGIEYHVADGEADREVAALANHRKCPVLASDSDYFLFNLKYGVIHFDRYCENLVRKATELEIKPLYYLSDFQRQFSLKQYELLLILPSIFGNDYLQTYQKKTPENYEKVITRLAKYETCEQYLESAKASVTAKTFQPYRQQYSDLQLPDYYDSGNLAATKQEFPDLPEWVLAAFKGKEFPPQLLAVYKNRTGISPRIVEAIQHDSAWKISRGIRQYLYSFMGIPEGTEIKECIRADSAPKMVDESVYPKSLKLPEKPVSVNDKLFLEQNTELLSGLVLCVLKCKKLSPDDQRDIFDTLADQWKLPIAATFYWYRMLEDPPSQRKFVKSLLLTFLTCSGEIPNRARPVPPVTKYTKASHLEALHALAKWQCVYSDAMALNLMARQPFSTISPSCLYSGSVAMYYATITNLANDRFIVGEKWELYNQFLYLVTGCDEEGRQGKHMVRTKDRKDSGWQVAK